MCEVLFSRPFVKQVKITAKSEKSFGNHFSTFIVHFANVHMYILPKLLRWFSFMVFREREREKRLVAQ